MLAAAKIVYQKAVPGLPASLSHNTVISRSYDTSNAQSKSIFTIFKFDLFPPQIA